MTLQACLVLMLSLGGAAMDLVEQKVRNYWICLGWGTGLCYQLLCRGHQGIFEFLPGVLLPVLVLYPLFLFRMLGAGDIKLFSALGGIMGSGCILWGIFWAFLYGALLSAAFMAACGIFTERLVYFWEYMREYSRTRVRKPYYRRGKQAENIHFTIPIFMGVLMFVGGAY